MHRAYIAQIMNATEYPIIAWSIMSVLAYRHAKLDISTSFIE